MNFDINAIESSAQATFNVDVGKRDDGSPVGFTIVGTGSAEYLKADRAIQLLNVKEAANRDGRPIDTKSDDGAQYVVDGSERRREIVLSHCVVGWYGFTLGQTEVAPFTPETFSRVMRAKPQWARLLSDAIENESNFASG